MNYRQRAAPCPKCRTELRSAAFDGIPYAHCPSCKGLWIGADALKALLLKQRSGHAADTVEQLAVGFHRQTRRPCVGCSEPLQSRHVLEVEVDYCVSCKGIFLDAGELNDVVVADAAYEPQKFPVDTKQLSDILYDLLTLLD